MPPPPPPPPPGGGPPPPPMPTMKSSGAAPDRGALLTQIRGGARLKKTTTNDRSAPIVGNKPNNASAAVQSASGGGNGSRVNGTFGGGGGGSGAPMGLGGLFAGGMPKLKPTGQREALGVRGTTSSSSPPKESPTNDQSPSPPRTIDQNQTLAQAIANRAAKMNEKMTPAPASMPVPKPAAVSAVKKSPSPESVGTSSHHAESAFPKDVSPPQKSRVGPGPPLPVKPPAASVNRSGSQTQTKRPTHKPPPPPKSNNTKFGTIGHPKRPSNTGQTQQLARRQSFGAPDSNPTLSVTKPQAAPPPPPPPRNMSVPSGMNTLHRNPPPVPPSHHQSTKRPIVPAVKPPPPPNKTTSRSTPHLASMVGGGSAVRAGCFESRFTFHNINDLTVSYEPTPNKRYPSKCPRKNRHQRQAPAPPPVAALS